MPLFKAIADSLFVLFRFFVTVDFGTRFWAFAYNFLVEFIALSEFFPALLAETQLAKGYDSFFENIVAFVIRSLWWTK